MVAQAVDRVIGIARRFLTSTEILRKRDGDVLVSDEEFAILDRAGRLQLPEAYIENLDMEDRVLVRLRDDHIGVYPEQEDNQEPANVQE